MCNPQGYVRRRERFEGVLKAVNGVLDFYGLRPADEGELRRTGLAARRRAPGLTTKALARFIGVDPATVTRLGTG